MISYRFHLVSITAIFLALAVGIGVGATVVDKATVDLVKGRLHAVEQRVDRTDKENAQLSDDLKGWRSFGATSSTAIVGGRLTDVPVLVLGVRGIDQEPVNQLRQVLQDSGARLEGTVWFTAKLRLDKAKDDDRVALAAILRTVDTRAPMLQQALVAEVATGLAQPGRANVLTALADGGFVEFDAPPPAPATTGTTLATLPPGRLPLPATRFVVVSSGTPDVANEVLAGPLTSALAKLVTDRVLAAEPALPATPSAPGQRSAFVGPLRNDGAVNGLLSTVDDLDDVRGRVAAVLALQDLGLGKVGHFGMGPRAGSVLPDPAP